MPILLLTFVEIALLRKGPDALPRSMVFLLFAAAFWFVEKAAGWALLPGYSGFEVAVSIASLLLSLIFYALFIMARGRRERLEQALTAIMGATTCVSFVILAWLVLFPPSEDRPNANLLLLLLWFWTVQVEGHIVSRTTGISLLSGVGIAAFVFVVQLLFTDFLISLQQAAPV